MEDKEIRAALTRAIWTVETEGKYGIYDNDERWDEYKSQRETISQKAGQILRHLDNQGLVVVSKADEDNPIV